MGNNPSPPKWGEHNSVSHGFLCSSAFVPNMRTKLRRTQRKGSGDTQGVWCIPLLLAIPSLTDLERLLLYLYKRKESGNSGD